ncbi:MAG: hypothetical protein GW833_02965 [Desulfuromonadales bacterium]|nr:hypothetical protein [Desulfuromonadales bacterium]
MSCKIIFGGYTDNPKKNVTLQLFLVRETLHSKKLARAEPQSRKAAKPQSRKAAKPQSRKEKQKPFSVKAQRTD